MASEKPPLRSEAWFKRIDNTGYEHRTHLKARGALPDMFEGKPVIGIANSASDLVPCNAHLTGLAEWVAKGVLEAGGFPLIFSTMSIGDSIMRPSGMLFRNMMSMELEATLRANPLDGVVLLTGCDNTAPAYMMGAASVDLPTIVVHGGGMINGKVGVRQVGSGSDIFRMHGEYKAGRMTKQAFLDSEYGMSRSNGHCNTMGTATTMGCLAEALGLSLSGSAAIPAVDGRRKGSAQLSGRRIVEMVREDLTFSKVVDRRALENAIRVNAALGGSTNAIIHLTALAGRLEIPLTLEDFEENCRSIPLLANIVPNGKFLVEEFYSAGGLPALIASLGERLNLDAITVSGRSLREDIGDATTLDEEIIAPFDRPVKPQNALRVLKGNLAPSGAVIKPSAASPNLLKHTGRAVVFESVEDLDKRIDDPALNIDETCVLVLKGIGPRGYPGMPELGNIRLPAHLLAKGVTDMVRVSDGRMSGTAYGTVVLHVAPESSIGGPLSLVRDGDMISLDVTAGSLTLEVPEDELERRRSDKPTGIANPKRGYERLFVDHVLQADKGLDFDFLVGRSGSAAPTRRPF
ncbi:MULTISPECIES: dihydroxy-acid dehydratase [unclassified Mesorhizobium]|uniref:dihydroxy-acid dehydratase n=1 Tax=unclassified Mesorhizobium TaxID=325217 RepID=UPI002414F287|nr:MULTISPECIES: dihydroxy-acid dehydratase [unclassified Mesorhizobium]MDG4889919.1 dihydroxy-acid dehydratase [Mesorhizobium sp. WSM4887]MDG4904062.1 dihydroxy-acid dehydratase [Mesorhizobium sp. WSM4962]MDG4909089.1 dihydroxy-acid dehydratase [Mesorhizobium sp. WSM4898]MDG4921713.1 dihydroxy-acid dehydratase [Mesorhizobium sp. WSM4989]